MYVIEFYRYLTEEYKEEMLKKLEEQMTAEKASGGQVSQPTCLGRLLVIGGGGLDFMLGALACA